ncbi:MAG: hypothetical protein AAFO72_03890 [Pseudomonadota bacterium]
MLSRILYLPLILPLTGVFAAAMFVPALHALYMDDHSVAQAFFYSGILGFAFVAIIGLSLANRSKTDNSDLENLASLFLAYTALPLFLALPFYEGLETTSYLNAYVEMVSSFTTTGAPLFEAYRLTESLHLWRGIVGWLGGLVIWVSASAVLAPLNLGGFEVTARAEPGQGEERFDRFERASSAKRITRISQDLIPIYAGLTFLVWLFMVVANEDPTTAAILAMSTLATSGITLGWFERHANGLLRRGGDFSISRLWPLKAHVFEGIYHQCEFAAAIRPGVSDGVGFGVCRAFAAVFASLDRGH